MLGVSTPRGFTWHILSPFTPVAAGEYTVVPLPASHMEEGNEPFIYHITDTSGASLLYLIDSGYYKEEAWDYFRAAAEGNGPVDMVVLDTTDAATETDHSRHMGFSEVKRVRERMLSTGIIDGDTLCVLDHFSHNGRYLYDEMRAVAGEDYVVAYDGMELEI